MRWIKNLYLSQQFFAFIIFAVVGFVFSFFFPFLHSIMLGAIIVFLIVVLWDFLILFIPNNPLIIKRIYPEKLSNGDINDFYVFIENLYSFSIKFRVIEELPIQFQIRDFNRRGEVDTQKSIKIHYTLRPTKRGEYIFNSCHVFVRKWGFVERRISIDDKRNLICYPSFLQLKKYQLLATTNRLNELGIKKLRRIGNTLEFESIKEYQRGDEYRFINWKATAKMQKIMVNQYQDEKAQPIYSFIDKGRAMRMPFDGMTLLDYAINASLVLSNITIVKEDKAGILTFAEKIEDHVPAAKRNHQMYLINKALYKIKTDFKETEFGKLYAYTKQHINQRALLLLFTNFETSDALKRQMKHIKLLNKSHLVVVILFKNVELLKHAREKNNKNIHEIYTQIIIEKFLYEKELIIQKLKANGIQTIYTTPQDLTVNTINKYLEIKAKGLI